MPDMINETAKVRFGMASTRELEIEVEPGHNIATEFETALNEGANLLWITDTRGYQHGIVLEAEVGQRPAALRGDAARA